MSETGKIRINEIVNGYFTDHKDMLVQVHAVDAQPIEMAFRRMYALRRSARYDGTRRYEFVDPSLEPAYQKWRDRNETVEMYYGNAVVD